MIERTFNCLISGNVYSRRIDLVHLPCHFAVGQETHPITKAGSETGAEAAELENLYAWREEGTKILPRAQLVLTHPTPL
jgi:hypothetical protein